VAGGWRERRVTQVIVNPSGATRVLSNFIPAGARLKGVLTRVQTELGGATGYGVGDGSDADRWGVAAAATAGTTTGGHDNPPTADPAGFFASAQNVVLTATGSNFDGTGSVRMTAILEEMIAPVQ